jgi:hypothetical protein
MYSKGSIFFSVPLLHGDAQRFDFGVEKEQKLV